MPIKKSAGVTPTEEYLAALCEKTFLNLWSYPNPFKEDGKELCDLLVVFEDNVLIFFDRESHRLKDGNRDLITEWRRWRREVIDKQLSTAAGAARYIQAHRRVYLDSECKIEFPIQIPIDARIHKIIVAHGAMEACRANSSSNVSGSLAIGYGLPKGAPFDEPFFVDLDRRDPVHVFDSENLDIVLSELDTIFDLVEYFNAKNDAISKYHLLTYCGEEDLVAHYFLNFDKRRKKHFIGSKEEFDFVHIGEGEYQGFRQSEAYRRRKIANDASRTWDHLIQKTGENALRGTLIGNGNPFEGRSAIHYMAKEPRFVRRTLSQQIERSIRGFPENDAPIMRNVTLLPSFLEGTCYVFLQLKANFRDEDPEEYRQIRAKILEVACAAAKLKFPKLERVIGIAIDAPKYAKMNSEDFLLMEFDEWTEELASEYDRLNAEFGFFKTAKPKRHRFYEFPPAERQSKPRAKKLGRNDPCPCGSGRKYKKCHYPSK